MSYKRLVKDLPVKVLKKLSVHLNPSMIVGGDWKSMAGEFGMTYSEILNYDRQPDPTMYVLAEWWQEGGDKTVTELLSVLRKIKREDTVRLLSPHENYGK